MTLEELIRPELLWDLSRSLAAEAIRAAEHPWDVFERISDIVLEAGPRLVMEKGWIEISEKVFVAPTAVIAPTASLHGPCLIGERTEVRHCAFIRGSVIIGNDCVIGNSTELKSSILFDRAKAPHYNYIGNSILGVGAHMGAGSIISNLKSDETPVTVRLGSESLPTGRRKFGALLGDRVEVGCGTVINPGTVVGAHSRIYPSSTVRGSIPANHIYKDRDHVVPIL